MMRTTCRVRPERSTAAMVLGDGLLLALILTGLFLFQFNVYGLPGGRNVVLGCCLGAALLSLIIFSLPKYRWAAVLVVLAAGLVLLWRHWDRVALGARVVYSTIAHVITESTGFPGEYPIPAVWTAGTRQLAANCFLSAVIFALSLPLGWAVVRRRAFLPVFTLTLPWLIPIFLAEFPPDVLSLSMLCACWMALALSGLTFRHDPVGGAKLTLAALPAALLALLCVCLIFPQEEYVHPAWASSAARWLTEVGEQIENPFLSGPGESGRAASSVDLAHTGPRRYTGRALLRVDSRWKGLFYLRGSAYANYTGGSWERLDDEAQAELEALGYGVTPAYAYGTYQEAGGGKYSSDNPVEQWAAITHLDGEAEMAYYPYLMTELSGTAVYEGDSYLRLTEPLESYTVRFLLWKGKNESGFDREYREFVYEHYLDVPEELEDTLESWWKMWVIVSADPWSQFYDERSAVIGKIWSSKAIDQIAGLLEQSAKYDLNTPVTPEGEDFVEYFLFQSHQGYCVHFATAAVLLLRQVGVPARYVSGYAVQLDGGEVNVTDSSAHAWVEVYEDGLGWTALEVTPPAGLGGGSEESPEVSHPVGSATPAPSDSPDVSAEPSDAPSVQPSAEPGGLGGEDGAAVGFVQLWGVAAILAVLCLPALYRAFRRRRWNRLATQPDNNRAALDAYRWYCGLAPWGGKADDQMEALARKAKFSQHTLTDGERAEALAILRRETAQLSKALPAWKRWLFRYLYVWK